MKIWHVFQKGSRNDFVILSADSIYDSYLWLDNTTDYSIEVLDSGWYSVIVSDTICITKDSVHIGYINSPVLDLGADSSICPNTSYSINLTGFQYSLWQDFTVGPSYLIDDSLLVYVEAYDSFGCLFKDTLSISVDTSLKVDIAEDTLLCYGDTLILDAQNPVFNYFWQDSSITQVYNASSKGNYSVTVTDTIGCEQSDSMFLDMLDQRITPP
ncbi:MAG TPA: hypothetical protein EYQ86_03515, partial [Bacteroidetes bacterium]|nr:hypothetical protein [Bacteroidota bacterium]